MQDSALDVAVVSKSCLIRIATAPSIADVVVSSGAILDQQYLATASAVDIAVPGFDRPVCSSSAGIPGCC